MKKRRVTVMRITQYADRMAQYENSIEHTCDMRLGQTFIVENCAKPDGMCDSAWGTLLPFVSELAAGGGNFFDGWMQRLCSRAMMVFVRSVFIGYYYSIPHILSDYCSVFRKVKSIIAIPVLAP